MGFNLFGRNRIYFKIQRGSLSGFKSFGFLYCHVDKTVKNLRYTQNARLIISAGKL